MSHLQTLLLALGTIFTSVTHAAVPGDIPNGKIPGYTKGPLPYSSDFLTSTFCYCAQPSHDANSMVDAHYFLHEYYNVHENATFVLEQKCKSSPEDHFTCLKAVETIVENPREEFKETTCNWWRRYDEHAEKFTDKADKLCFVPPESQFSKTDNFLVFNKQKRNLSKQGLQDPVPQPQSMVDGVCTDYCQDHMGIPYLNETWRTDNKIIFYETMDDMCDGCH